VKHRLTRLDEIYPGYSIFFITFCTYQHQVLLANSSVHDSFYNFAVLAQKRNVLVVAM
jgi:REP element-mobilizing transposase RayT